MSTLVDRRSLPADGARVPSLLELMHEGFHLLFLLRHGSTPPAEAEFVERIGAFLAEFERAARRQRASNEDIEAAKYAWCAALDEIVLASPFPLRAAWERRPLQLLLFGDQLAGEHFFDRLEELRSQGGAHVQALQVFHMCLLLGFKGRFALDDSDRLAYLTQRLGDEITHIRGRSKGFAPRAERPDQVAHKLRSNTPLWVMSAVFGLVALGAFGGMRASLAQASEQVLAAYANVVKLAPRPASLTVTLP